MELVGGMSLSKEPIHWRFGACTMLVRFPILPALLLSLGCGAETDLSDQATDSTVQKSAVAEVERLRALPVPEGIEHPEWIEMDRELFLAMRALVPPPGSGRELRELLERQGFELDELESQSEPDLDTAIALYHRDGGYSGCSVTAHLFDDEPTRVDLSCRPSTTAGVFEFAEDALGDLLAPSDGSLDATFDWAEREAARDARRAEVLGAMGSAQPPPALRDAYERLTNPGYGLTFGTECGYAGTPTAGREALETLVAAEAVDLLRQVLRGPNVGGRLYAAEGLVRLDAVSASDEEAIAGSASAEVTRCDGCIVSGESFADAFAALQQSGRRRQGGD